MGNKGNGRKVGLEEEQEVTLLELECVFMKDANHAVSLWLTMSS